MRHFGVVAPRKNSGLWNCFRKQISRPKGIERAPRSFAISLEAVDKNDTKIDEHSLEKGGETHSTIASPGLLRGSESPWDISAESQDGIQK